MSNIIVFVAADANWNDFGPYGNDIIQTPTINKLAEDGLTVNKAFLMVGQCSPSVEKRHDPQVVRVPPYLVDDEATRGDLAPTKHSMNLHRRP